MFMRENEVFFCGASDKEGREKVQMQKHIYIKNIIYIFLDRSIQYTCNCYELDFYDMFFFFSLFL